MPKQMIEIDVPEGKEWLKAEWLVQNALGEWLTTTYEPYMSGLGMWTIRRGMFVPLSEEVFSFTPPPCSDWKQSKRRNPYLERAKDA